MTKTRATHLPSVVDQRTILSASPAVPVARSPARGSGSEDPGPGTEVRGEGPKDGVSA